ncbi:MAG: chaperone NapD [Desulfovibrio sp.]|nr:chaperone NapD [Desulfovibrio sp.]
MAITSLVLTIADEDLPDVLRALANYPILDKAPVHDVRLSSTKLALVLECSSLALPSLLQEMERIPGVVDLTMVYANFEEDLLADGTMPCPSRDPETQS